MREEPEAPDLPIDWAGLIGELQGMAVSRIGKRANKINGLLGSADQSAAGVQAVLKQIDHLSIPFVDPVAIDDLVYEMEQYLAARAGLEPPLRRGVAPWWTLDSGDPGLPF